MNDEDAFLRAIAEQPDDDTARLVFADWLDERDDASCDARAEFIRLQIRAARMSYDDPERETVRQRSDQLLNEWGNIWQREMPAGFRVLSGYRRGFAYRAAAIASAVERAADNPLTFLLEYLELGIDVSTTGLRVVVKQPLFARLTELVVRSEIPIGWSGAKALAEGDYPRLERLGLARQAIGDVGLRYLCNSWGLMRLRELDLSMNDITDDGITALLRSGLTARIQRLDLWGNPISHAMMERVRNRDRMW